MKVKKKIKRGNFWGKGKEDADSRVIKDKARKVTQRGHLVEGAECLEFI